MTYIPVQTVSVINPAEGTEKNGDLKVVQENGSWVVYIRLNGDWKQIFPAVFA